MTTYSNIQVAETFQRYAEWLKRKLDDLNRFDTLPTFGAKAEIAARKKAVKILQPVYYRFASAAQEFGYEAKRDATPTSELDQMRLELDEDRTIW